MGVRGEGWDKSRNGQLQTVLQATVTIRGNYGLPLNYERGKG